MLISRRSYCPPSNQLLQKNPAFHSWQLVFFANRKKRQKIATLPPKSNTAIFRNDTQWDQFFSEFAFVTCSWHQKNTWNPESTNPAFTCFCYCFWKVKPPIIIKIYKKTCRFSNTYFILTKKDILLYFKHVKTRFVDL